MNSVAASRAGTANDTKGEFYGWRVVGAVFVLATFGWGLGFYGPPVYLHAVHELRGWSLDVISTAVTVHFLFGAIVIAKLPWLYRRFGVARVTKAGSLARNWDHGLGDRSTPLATFCCYAVKRWRLGDYGSSRGQRDHRSVVCAKAACGACIVL